MSFPSDMERWNEPVRKVTLTSYQGKRPKRWEADVDILNIRPTIFVSERAGMYFRRIESEVSSSLTDSRIEIRDSARPSADWATVDTTSKPADTTNRGQTTVSFDIPELDRARTIEFRIVDRSGHGEPHSCLIHPARKWTVHVVQLSHHDAGYTDLSSRVLDDHCRWLDDALEYAASTKSFPDDSRFRMVIEQGWSLFTWLDRTSNAKKERMIELLQTGDVELTALFGNMITEICGHEELIRTLYPAFELGRRYGIPIVSAEHNDIPGFSWGLSRILADSGVRIFCPGIPRYYDWGGDDLQLQSYWDDRAIFDHNGPGAFWWQTPTGKRILFWCNNSGCGGDSRGGMPGLALRLEELESEGWPYSIIRWPVSGGARDNSPYADDYAETIRAWNDTWTYPHLISSTNAKFYADFSRDLPKDLPVFEGELPGQDYPVGATSTAHPTGVNRRTQSELPEAELLSTGARISVHAKQPEEELRRAWEDLLWYDEHAWGHHFPAGPAMEAALAEKSVHAFRAAALAQDIRAKAMASIADAVDAVGAVGAVNENAKAKGDANADADVSAETQAEAETETKAYEKEDLWTLTVFNTAGVADGGARPVRVPLRGIDNCGSTMYYVPPGDDPQSQGYRRGVILNNRWHVNLPEELHQGNFTLRDLTTGERLDFEIETVSSADSPVPFAPERTGLAAGGKRYGMFEQPDGIARDLIFVDRGLPPFGYNTYNLDPCTTNVAANRKANSTALQTVTSRPGRNPIIENEYYEVRVDPDSGAIVSIYDKSLEQELIDDSCPHMFGDLVVREPVFGSAPRRETTSKSWEIASIHEGSVYQYCEATSTVHGHPQITRRVTLYAGIRAVFADFRILKDPTPLVDVHISFPFLTRSPRFRYSGTLSTLTPIADFFPGAYSDTLPVQEWVGIEDNAYSIIWSAVDAPVVSLGALHPGYVSPAHRCRVDASAAHPPLGLDDIEKGWIYSAIANNNFGTNFAVSQNGSFLMRYVFTTGKHEIDPEASRFGRLAALPVNGIFANRGAKKSIGKVSPIPPRGSFIELSTPEVQLLAFKVAEDGNGYIIRLWNRCDQAVSVGIRLPGISVRAVMLCDPTERELEEDIRQVKNIASCAIPSDHVVTIRIIPESSP